MVLFLYQSHIHNKILAATMPNRFAASGSGGVAVGVAGLPAGAMRENVAMGLRLVGLKNGIDSVKSISCS